MMNSHKPHSKKKFIILQSVILAGLLSGCSGLEESEQEKLREQNAKGEYIYRYHNETVYPVQAPRHRTREPYSWEQPPKKN